MEPLDIRPPTQEEIPEVLRQLRQQAETAENEYRWCLARIETVQDICKHPQTTKGNTWGRWPYTRCEVCGKEW